MLVWRSFNQKTRARANRMLTRVPRDRSKPFPTMGISFCRVWDRFRCGAFAFLNHSICRPASRAVAFDDGKDKSDSGSTDDSDRVTVARSGQAARAWAYRDQVDSDMSRCSRPVRNRGPPRLAASGPGPGRPCDSSLSPSPQQKGPPATARQSPGSSRPARGRIRVDSTRVSSLQRRLAPREAADLQNKGEPDPAWASSGAAGSAQMRAEPEPLLDSMLLDEDGVIMTSCLSTWMIAIMIPQPERQPEALPGLPIGTRASR